MARQHASEVARRRPDEALVPTANEEIGWSTLMMIHARDQLIDTRLGQCSGMTPEEWRGVFVLAPLA
jgi:hypothetical protein